MLDMLTVNFGNRKTYSNQQNLVGHTSSLVDSMPSKPWKTMRHRQPWQDIANKHYKGMNFFFTINPDPDIDFYENTKKFLIPKILILFDKLKSEGLIKKSLIIYEWGKFGKKHGKLHFHGFLQTKDKQTVSDKINQVFNKKTNLRHLTTRLNHIKTVDDRNRMITYMKKEQHNKLKILYWN